MAAAGTPCASGELAEGRLTARAHRHHGACADSLNRAVNGSSGSRTVHTGPAAQAGLGERDGQAAVGQVMRGGQQPGRDRRREQRG